MADSYKQMSVTNGETHFTSAPTNDVGFSQMLATSRHLTTFNGGDIVPIYCREVLPGESLTLDLDFVIRQTTLLRPVFGELFADIYAFFVPNRIVNESWVNVEGENSAGAGLAPDVTLAPLVMQSSGSTSVPVGSVADYYGFPTQQPISNSILAQMHDLKFRGYLAIYNEFFRDQNYQPPVPFSKLNIFENFFTPYTSGSGVAYGSLIASGGAFGQASGSTPNGAFVKAIYGEGADTGTATTPSLTPAYRQWSALNKPLKANKLHDFFTSVLPYPQKGLSLSIMFPGEAQVYPVVGGSTLNNVGVNAFRFGLGSAPSSGLHQLLLNFSGGNDGTLQINSGVSSVSPSVIQTSNLQVSVPAGSLGTLDISNLRTAVATQQVFEIMARAGSRYREFVQAMFGISADDPYKTVPLFLGHVRRTLNNYQVAQTSQSADGSTPQANLAAYSYTANGGRLFEKTFLEHGYVHVMCVVRQKNLYTTMLWKDNFRRSFLDFYMAPLANISEQPVATHEINGVIDSSEDSVFGYQEAWAEYRYEPDMASGLFREGVEGALTTWIMPDKLSEDLQVATGAWLYSNAQEVIDPTLAVSSSQQPQFFAEFAFRADKRLPMPVYSVPGLDIF